MPLARDFVYRAGDCFYLSAAVWKTALPESVHVPIKSTSMKNGAKSATWAEAMFHGCVSNAK